MSNKRMFSDMDSGTRRFFSKLVNTAMVNIYAVEHGLFDSLLCESDDPDLLQRWKDAEPLIMDTIQRSIDADDPDEHNRLGL